MKSNKDYYMDSNFLPQKVTMARLREILDAHDISYNGKEKKAGLVEIFNTQIRPLIPSLREKEMKNQSLMENIATSSGTSSHSDQIISKVASTSTSRNIEYSKINNKRQSNGIFGNLNIFELFELIKSQLSRRGWKFTYATVFLTLIFGLLIKYYIQSNMVTSFCDNQLRGNTKNSFFEANCIPCPPYAHCSKGKITSCDEGFALASSSIYWLKPFTSRCIFDFNRERKVKVYTKLLKSIAIEEIGKTECESSPREVLLFQNLLVLLRSKKLPRQDDEKKFKIFSQLALENLRSDDQVKTSLSRTTNADSVIGHISPFGVSEISSFETPNTKIYKTKITALSMDDSDYLSIKRFFISGLPHCTVLGILKLNMPTKLVEAHEKYKRQNYDMLTHRMFHGTKSLCDPQRFITNSQAIFCNYGCGVCGIMKEGNKTTYASSRRRNSSTSYNYCNTSLLFSHYSYMGKNNYVTNAMFVVDVVARNYESVLTVERDE
ncbi:2296_t:CDS:2, partial [Cetraspora pellucida]